MEFSTCSLLAVVTCCSVVVEVVVVVGRELSVAVSAGAVLASAATAADVFVDEPPPSFYRSFIPL